MIINKYNYFLKIPSEIFNVSNELISYYLLCWEMPGAEQIAIPGQVRWEDHPAPDSMRWAKGECWQTSMTPDKTYRDICAVNTALSHNKNL